MCTRTFDTYDIAINPDVCSIIYIRSLHFRFLTINIIQNDYKIVMNATVIPSLETQSLITQVQIQAINDFKHEIVIISLPDNYYLVSSLYFNG